MGSTGGCCFAFHDCLLSYRTLHVLGKTEGPRVGYADIQSHKMVQPQMKVHSGNLVREQAQLFVHVAL